MSFYANPSLLNLCNLFLYSCSKTDTNLFRSSNHCEIGNNPDDATPVPSHETHQGNYFRKTYFGNEYPVDSAVS